jgi:hypothetical protein
VTHGSAAASHVLLIQPSSFRFNPQTGATNVFQEKVSEPEERALAEQAIVQHGKLRDLLVDHGVTVTLSRSLDSTPDGPFCNNWFSTHPGGEPGRTLVLYPLLAENRRPERRPDLIALLAFEYPHVVDLSGGEQSGRYLESTGSLVIDHRNRVAYAALSPRTDAALAEEWAREMGYHLVAFRAIDPAGTPYYHTNVVMFIGHGVAGVSLEAIAAPGERNAVERRLREDGNELIDLTRDQVGEYCGNCLALASGAGDPLFIMSSRAWRGFSPAERQQLERHGRVLHTELSAFEKLGGGSARCLIGELF